MKDALPSISPDHGEAPKITIVSFGDYEPYSSPDNRLGDISLQASKPVGPSFRETELGRKYQNGSLYSWEQEELDTLRTARLKGATIEASVVPPSEDNYAKTRADKLHLLHTQAKIAGIEGEWASRTPKDAIDEMIGALPDEVPKYTLDTLHLMPKDEPSQLELYFMSKLPSLADFGQDDKPEGTLSVMESILCLRDQVRTKRFLQGISESVSQLEASSEGIIEVCDAGTGAIPVLSIYAALCSDRVQCTALELNPNSAAIARQIVGAFGLQERIKVIESDATKFVPEKPLDLLVSETMHSGLTEEPIVQILSNLQPYVRDEGLTLPSGIQIKASLVSVREWSSSKEYVKIYGNQHIIFDANWQKIADYRPGDQLEQVNFSIPTEGLPPDLYLLFVTSDVEVGSGRLATSQSLITMPQCTRDTNGNEEIFQIDSTSQPSEIVTNYKPGQKLNGVSHIVAGVRPERGVSLTAEIVPAELERYLQLRGPEDFAPNQGIDIPDEPTFLRVAELTIRGAKIDSKPGEFSNITLHDVNVFFCHAESDENGLWVGDTDVLVPHLLAKFRERHDLTLSLTCNPGAFRLSNDLIYPIGEPSPIPSCFNGKEGIILEAHLAFEHPDARPVFHIPERYFNK